MSQIENDGEEIEMICVQKIASRGPANERQRAAASVTRDGRLCGVTMALERLRGDGGRAVPASLMKPLRKALTRDGPRGRGMIYGSRY